MVRKIAALAAVAAVIATPAFAADAVAQLSNVSGSVTVASNGKTAPATATALKAGDRVVASNGAASVKFADGCVVSLKAGSMVTVGAKSPCATGAGVVSANSAEASAIFGLEGGAAAAATFVVGAALIGVISEAQSDSP